MSARIKLPKARIGDVIVGDIHPDKGFVMFEVDHAYYESKYGHWHYQGSDTDGKPLEMTEQWVEHVYKRKDLK